MFLFCFYISDILVTTKQENPNVELQAFVDDIVIQATSTTHIQKSFGQLTGILKGNNMIINPEKCELIAEDEDSEIIARDSDHIITPSPSAKYLGQHFDNNGDPKSTITQRNFGKIINILKHCNISPVNQRL